MIIHYYKENIVLVLSWLLEQAKLKLLTISELISTDNVKFNCYWIFLQNMYTKFLNWKKTICQISYVIIMCMYMY